MARATKSYLNNLFIRLAIYIGTEYSLQGFILYPNNPFILFPINRPAYLF
ncbi:hypothetical protein KL86DYS1_10646 [uncultured Dysgonomonas sp.]|uniref:Uncharacterized protein n=1 Tax=uncultured Dysgonomonas sp. TaxID=206096 RepID=A0A212IZF7_9BACT|nr:hypothetical protein KL86DYS1_10646 [uncultured Dysgonomonas sp.]